MVVRICTLGSGGLGVSVRWNFNSDGDSYLIVGFSDIGYVRGSEVVLKLGDLGWVYWVRVWVYGEG